MREIKICMGMPIIVEVVEPHLSDQELTLIFKKVFDYFVWVDEKFSTYKSTSEISAINAGVVKPEAYSDEMKEIFLLSEKTKQETEGYFNIVTPDGKYDPSGIVKGWAIYNAGCILKKEGIHNFYIDAGGDIEVLGNNEDGKPWRIGIANPFISNAGYSVEAKTPVIKVLAMTSGGVATSGTSIRGQHIYDPHITSQGDMGIYDIVSLTVIGPNVYEADRFATAAFAMGKKGIHFIESLRDKDIHGYMVDATGVATMTTGFEQYVSLENK